MKLLFWNLQKKDLHLPLKELAVNEGLDIIAAAEGDSLNAAELKKLGYKQLKTLSNVLVFTKYSQSVLKVIREGARYSILNFVSPVNGEIIICITHMISQNNSSETDRTLETALLMQDVVSVKDQFNTEHAVICGDLNQNPYDPGVASAACFNATGDRVVAKKMKRTVQGRQYRYYYNPMWKFYGTSDRPHGTYFHRASNHFVVNWNILDQFLISASLLENIADNDFKIIKETPTHKLIRSNGNIDYRNYSDHLPILMSSNI